MKKATIRELHLHTGSIVSEAAEGHVITILKRGVPVAELRPIGVAPRPRGFLDRDDWLARFPKVRSDSGKILEEDRS